MAYPFYFNFFYSDQHLALKPPWKKSPLQYPFLLILTARDELRNTRE